MSLISTFGMVSAGMNVQRERLNVAAENLANVSTTKTSDGGVYQRKSVIVGAQNMQDSFDVYLKKASLQQPQITTIEKSTEDSVTLYDPSHPDADEKGFIHMPNISTTKEMVDMMSASSAYQANMSVFSEAKTMFMRTLDIAGV